MPMLSPAFPWVPETPLLSPTQNFMSFAFLQKTKASQKLLQNCSLLLLKWGSVDRQRNGNGNLGACTSCFLQKRWGDECCVRSPTTMCNSCKGLRKQDAVWAVPAAGTADPHLFFKGGNLLLLALTWVSYDKSYLCCSLPDPLVYTPSIISNSSLCKSPCSDTCSLPFPHSCCVCNAHFSRSRLTAPTPHSSLLFFFLDKNLLSSLIDSHTYSWQPLQHLWLTL